MFYFILFLPKLYIHISNRQ